MIGQRRIDVGSLVFYAPSQPKAGDVWRETAYGEEFMMADETQRAKLYVSETTLKCDGQKVFGPPTIHPDQLKHWRLEFTSCIPSDWRYLTGLDSFCSNPESWWTLHKERCDDEPDKDRMDGESLTGGE